LKTRFAPPREFEENLNYRHLHKIRTIGRAFRIARQPRVHHATDRSPFNPPFTMPDDETRAHAGLARFRPAEPQSSRLP
jgi:hypothetical protein